MSTELIVVPAAQLQDYVGHEFGPSAWLETSQAMVDAFADLTGDHQFIHVDPQRAAQTMFGGTIVHGFLSLSLLPVFMAQMGVYPDNAAMGLNYGLNKVRFLTPVRTGQRIRGRIVPLSFEAKGEKRILVTNQVTVEIEGEEKPALVAEALGMFMLT